MKASKIVAALVSVVAFPAFATAGGCGGKVVVGAAGEGGGGGSATSTSVTNGTSVTTGTTKCLDHADCPGGLCLFGAGTCAQKCESDFCPECGAGTVCDSCATSSCPDCDDCRSACVPTLPGFCDGSDPCPAGQVCLFQQQRCAAACQNPNDCPDFEFCLDCATGSCCGCEDCVSACVGGE